MQRPVRDAIDQVRFEQLRRRVFRRFFGPSLLRIADTEELYSVRHGGEGESAEVTVLARLGSEALDCALAGWRRVCDSDQPGSYEWLLERAAAAWRAAAPAF